MINVYILRHGQTQWNAEGNRYCGRTDVALTETGVQQAKAISKQLQDLHFEGIYSSPLLRARHTAVLASGGRNVSEDPRLIEADFGDWEGKTKEQFIPENEGLWKRWMTDPFGARAGGTGETGKEVVERVDDFFKSMLQRHASGNILVVAHNGVNGLYLAHKLGMPLQHYRRLHIDNCSITMFRLEDSGEMTLVHLNSRV